MRPASSPRCSVVVPAHQEESVIGNCLAPLADLVARGDVEVVVAANGCTDRTVEVARSFAGVRVVEVAAASKVAALNAGDRAAAAWPRLYLDADVVVPADAVLALAAALTTAEPLVGSVAVRFATSGRPWPVRAFYRAYRRTPYLTDRLVGLGLYGLSQAGRARFADFPDITADDLFVQQLFAPHERRVLAQHAFEVQVPRTVRALVAVRSRSAWGATQVARAGGSTTTSSTLRTLVRLVLREPQRTPDVAVYVVVTALARQAVRRAVPGTWQRDATTR